MKITTRCADAWTTIEVSGTIDVYSAGVVGEAIQSLIAEGVKHIVLDLSSVGSIDSSGLGTLVGNAKAIASIGGTISLAGANARVRKMLTVTNLGRYFRIQDSEAAALSGASCEKGV